MADKTNVVITPDPTMKSDAKPIPFVNIRTMNGEVVKVDRSLFIHSPLIMEFLKGKSYSEDIELGMPKVKAAILELVLNWVEQYNVWGREAIKVPDHIVDEWNEKFLHSNKQNFFLISNAVFHLKIPNLMDVIEVAVLKLVRTRNGQQVRDYLGIVG